MTPSATLPTWPRKTGYVSKWFRKINRKLSGKPFWKQIAWFTFFMILPMTLLAMPFILLAEAVWEEGKDPDINNFFLIVIFAPLIETLINQYLPYKILNRWKYFRQRQALIILMASVLFGLMHTYYPAYMVWAFFQGLVLSYVFYFYRRNLAVAFFATALVHALRNAFSFSMHQLGDVLCYFPAG